jgi:hypothetical protein
MAGLQAYDKAPVRDHFLVEGGWVLLAVKSRVNRPQLTAGLVTGGGCDGGQGGGSLGHGVLPEVAAGDVERCARIPGCVP